jgi:RNA polymerase sigma-70 factor (sigma-E family)
VKALSEPPSGPRLDRPPAVVVSLVDRDREFAVRKLYQDKHAEMVRFATFLTGDQNVAEDLAHDAFVRVYDAWSRIADSTKAVAYLRATVVNLSNDRFRRRAVAERSPREHVIAGAAADEAALGSIGRRAVLAAVSALPERQRACVVMRHWLRMTEGEIADTLEVSIGSVRTHIKRGVSTLQTRLGHLQ